MKADGEGGGGPGEVTAGQQVADLHLCGPVHGQLVQGHRHFIFLAPVEADGGSARDRHRCRVFSQPCLFPGGPGGMAGSPRGCASILFLGRQKENVPRPVEEKKRFGRTGGTPVREYGGRANRPVRRRKPRRPCVLPRCLKDRIPAFDGGGVAVGSDLNGRISIPARSASLRAGWFLAKSWRKAPEAGFL